MVLKSKKKVKSVLIPLNLLVLFIETTQFMDFLHFTYLDWSCSCSKYTSKIKMSINFDLFT